MRDLYEFKVVIIIINGFYVQTTISVSALISPSKLNSRSE